MSYLSVWTGLMVGTIFYAIVFGELPLSDYFDRCFWMSGALTVHFFVNRWLA